MKVRYKGLESESQWWCSDCYDPRGVLVEGQEYDLERKEVHSWHTKFFLQQHPGLAFNSVMFDEVV